MTGAHRTLTKRTASAAYLLLLALSLGAAYLLPTYPLFVFSLAVVNIIAVLGVNLVMGYAGQISLGHAGFAAIGAYATALLVGNYAIFLLACAAARRLPRSGFRLSARRTGAAAGAALRLDGHVRFRPRRRHHPAELVRARERAERDGRSPARAVRIRALPATVSRSDCPDRRRPFSARPQHRRFTTRAGVYRHSGE